MESGTAFKSNFGFVARYNKKGKPQGQMVYIWPAQYNGVDAIYRIKSNALTGLSFNGATYSISATLAGGANITITDLNGDLLFGDGNWRFVATVTDANLKTGDKFAITIWDKQNQLYKTVATTLLAGGNVVIHNPKK